MIILTRTRGNNKLSGKPTYSRLFASVLSKQFFDVSGQYGQVCLHYAPYRVVPDGRVAMNQDIAEGNDAAAIRDTFDDFTVNPL